MATKARTFEEATLGHHLKESVKLAKAGKRPQLTTALLGKGVSCLMDADGNYVLPKDQGLCVDLLYRARNRRLEMQRETERVARLENQIKEHFIQALSANSTGLAGRVALVKVELKPIPQVANWPKFYAYVRRTDQFDLLNRALSISAVNERLEESPKKAKDFMERAGLTIFRTKKCSVTKF